MNADSNNSKITSTTAPTNLSHFRKPPDAKSFIGALKALRGVDSDASSLIQHHWLLQFASCCSCCGGIACLASVGNLDTRQSTQATSLKRDRIQNRLSLNNTMHPSLSCAFSRSFIYARLYMTEGEVRFHLLDHAGGQRCYDKMIPSVALLAVTYLKLCAIFYSIVDDKQAP